MTKKKHQQDIESALSKALEPPKKRTPPPALNEILSQYTPPQTSAEREPAPPTALTPRTAGTAPTPPTSIAPTRDFAKVANSIVRQAVPAGLFSGKGKQLYDFLYLRTRGAIVPVRSVRITKENLMRGAGIGSERTLYKNMRRLVAAGLVQVHSLGGEHAGSEYTVLLPEEARPTPPTDATHASQKVETLPTAQSGVGGVGLNDDTKETSGEIKTFYFKTTTNDDEAQALSDLNFIISEAARKLTGRAPKVGEREQWAEVARVVVEELNEAAGRAGSVSSVPAFLAAHLRRKFAQKPTVRKGEGKQSAAALEIPAVITEPERRLTTEDIAAYAATVVDLLGEGKTLEEIETQFAGSMHQEDWAAVKGAAQRRNQI